MAAASADFKDADAATIINENEDDLEDFQFDEKPVNPANFQGKVNAADAKDFGIRMKTSSELKGDPLFAVEDATTEKFGAVKPWLGAIAHTTPSKPPANNPAVPDQNLALDWVYGYRGYDSFSNLVYNSKGHVVYPVAGVVVVYDQKNHSQSHYRGHTDDIVCLAQNNANKDIIATGQVASITAGLATHPHVCVFNSVTKQEWILKSDGKNLRRAVRCVAFSGDGKYLVTVGSDDNQMVTVWDWEKKIALATEKGDTGKIFGAQWNYAAGQQKEFATVGVKHMFLWTFDGAKLVKKRASLAGKYALQTFYSVSFSEKGTCCVGARDGSIYAFVGGVCKAIVANAHTGGVLTLDYYADGLVSGGEDGKVLIFDKTLKLKQTIQLPHATRSVFVVGTTGLLVGTGGSEIYTFSSFADGKIPEPIVRGHFDGELWGLSQSPVDAAAFCTAGEDNRLMAWNAKTHTFVRTGQINAKAGVKPKIRKAATDSKHPINQCARCVEYSPDGKTVAVGTNAGEVNVYTNEFKLIASVDLNKYGKRKLDVQTQNWIEVLCYSPNGKWLAVGTHGFVICILDVAGGYKHYASLKAHNAAITHLDWSNDSRYIQSVCRAYELLFHSIDEKDGTKCGQVTAIAGLKDVKWVTQTCIFGWPVQGIFSGTMDGTDVNYCDKNGTSTLLVTSDDFGQVNLFRYPCAKAGNKAKAYTGHSAHVTRVRFTADDQYVISTGGGDKGIFQWKVVG